MISKSIEKEKKFKHKMASPEKIAKNADMTFLYSHDDM